METETSPPAERLPLTIPETVVSEETAAVPSHVGVQPPPLGARMKASMNAFWPVLDIVVGRGGGRLSGGIGCGADPYQCLGRVAPLAGLPASMPTATAVPVASAVAPRSATIRLHCMHVLPVRSVR